MSGPRLARAAARHGERIHEALYLIEGAYIRARRAGWSEWRAERAGFYLAFRWLGFSVGEATRAVGDLFGETPEDRGSGGTVGRGG
jgi:hypothetical protein